MTEDSLSRFGIIDYSVFFLMLLVSAGIGFYYAWKERHKKTVDQVLLGGRKLKIFPVAMSIMASFTSAISILGFSREMYQFGSMYLLIGVSYFITQPFAAHVYVPFFHKLKITSAYEYLEKRFNSYVRMSASIIFCVQMFFYMSIVLYSPSLAIQQVTGIPLWISIFLTGFICTVYTSLGGMKAVVFTDTFQSIVMFSGISLIIILGTFRVGGVSVIYDRLKQGNRLEFFDFDPTPFKRHTFWSIMIGGFFTSLTVYGSNQATIQRYLTVPTVRGAQVAMYINLLGTFFILILCCMSGFVAFAYYYGCDPLLAGKIKKYDQILPYFVTDLLKDFYGIPGILISCVYSAALSTVSSGLNSLTAVVLHDFIYPMYENLNKAEMSQKRSMFLSKFLAGTFGLITIGLAFLCQFFNSTVLQLTLSIFGILGGPLLGVISLGMFVPFANSYGALCGLYLSVIVNFWISLGNNLYGQIPVSKEFSTDLCLNNFTSNLNSTFTKNINSDYGLRRIYDLSYYWFSLLAIIINFSVGIIVSLLTNSKLKKKNLDRNLLFDVKSMFIFKKQISNEYKLEENIEMIEKIHKTTEKS